MHCSKPCRKNKSRVSSRIFCFGGGEDCVQRSILCEAFKVFEPIFDQCTKKHKARVFIIRYCINSQNFWGGKLEGLGGKLPPRTPQ